MNKCHTTGRKLTNWQKNINPDREWKIYSKKKRALSFLNALCKLAATYSPTWCSSTIGANGLNFSVRNG